MPYHKKRKHILPSLEMPVHAPRLDAAKNLVEEGKKRIASHMAATKAHVDKVRASLPKPTMPTRPAMPERQKLVEQPALRRVARRLKRRRTF